MTGRGTGHVVRRWRGSRIASTLAALVLAVTIPVTVPAATPAANAVAGLNGYDISWPQCSTAQGGYALPLPPDDAALVVIGLTKGLPFTTNPCLGEQVSWAATRHVPAQAYTMAGFPTAAQLAQHGGSGPWQPLTRWAQLANTGYAEGRYAVDALAPASFAPRHVWVDVEPRPQQPWPTGSQTTEAENRAVVTGLVRALDEAGYSYGLYSNTSGWTSITGFWRAPGSPAWVTVGPRTRADAVAACGARSFSTGAPHLAQWWDSTRDYDVSCAAYVEGPPIPYPPNRPNDLLGDWREEMLARQSNGTLWLYTFTSARSVIGTGWQDFDVIDTIGDFTGDGVPDVLARRKGSGDLLLYPRTASATWGTPRVIGIGWAGMDRILGVGDVTGDTVPDIVARDRATGRLWLYPGAEGGGFAPRRSMGTGWNVFDTLIGAGDLTGDGIGDLLARKPDGTLWRYRGDGAGGWAGATRIGSGWKGYDLLTVPGDLTADGAPDLVARYPATGTLWIYPTDGAGGWRPRIRMGTGWNAMTAFS